MWRKIYTTLEVLFNFIGDAGYKEYHRYIAYTSIPKKKKHKHMYVPMIPPP